MSLDNEKSLENSKMIILSIEPNNDNNDNNDNNKIKEIIYNKIQPNTKKFNIIQKFVKNDENDNNDDNKNNNVDNYTYIKAEKGILSNLNNSDLKATSQIKNLYNPYVKNIKHTKFLKNKVGGSDKNNSFYKKKYEENSANYNSISDSNIEKKDITVKDISEISVKNIAIEKNKIILDGGFSSDEDQSNDELDV